MGAENLVVVHSGGESPPHGEGGAARWEQPVSLDDSLQERRQSMLDTNIDGKVQRTQAMLNNKRPSRLEPDAVKECAVVRTERIATRGGRRSGKKTPRRTTYLDPKGRRDKSMFVKREATEDVYGVVPQRLSDRAKAGLPEPQCPGVETSHSSVARLKPDASRSYGLTFRL